MKLVFALFASFVALTGCSSFNTQPQRAIINDVSVAAPLDSGYTVTAIDGGKATRASGKLATVVPVVVSPAGKHTITVEPKSGDDRTAQRFEATLEPSKTYRIGKKPDGTLTLVEHASATSLKLNGD